jgi:hypothetical protein
MATSNERLFVQLKQDLKQHRKKTEKSVADQCRAAFTSQHFTFHSAKLLTEP